MMKLYDSLSLHGNQDRDTFIQVYGVYISEFIAELFYVQS